MAQKKSVGYFRQTPKKWLLLKNVENKPKKGDFSENCEEIFRKNFEFLENFEKFPGQTRQTEKSLAKMC